MARNNQPAEKRVHLEDGSLEVIKYWRTIQGEGPFVGKPCVFVRLAGCNLACPSCDSQYTKGRNRFGYIDLATKVMAESLADSPLVVITGGEPFRQNIDPFVSYLVVQGMTVQIETNGTYGSGSIGRLRDVHIVCSPKTPKVADGLKVDAYKYVLSHGHVSKEDGLPTSVLGLPKPPARPPVNFNRNQIYIQPMDAGEARANLKNLNATMESCFTHGYRLCLQIHKYLGLE